MIILAPYKTEKAIQRIDGQNEISFRVRNNTTKEEIKKEFEDLFKSKVLRIRAFTTPKGHKVAIIKLTKEFRADDISTKLKLIA